MFNRGFAYFFACVFFLFVCTFSVNSNAQQIEETENVTQISVQGEVHKDKENGMSDEVYEEMLKNHLLNNLEEIQTSSLSEEEKRRRLVEIFLTVLIIENVRNAVETAEH